MLPPMRLHPVLWLVLGAFAVCTVVVVTSSMPTLLDTVLHDDSFYYLATAENLASGYGSTFDRINYTNGYHPLWFVIVALLSWVGVAHDQLVYVAIVAQAVIFACGLLMLYAVMLRRKIDPLIASVAIGVVYVGILPVLGWNLLETGLILLASAWLLWSLMKLDDDSAVPFTLGLAVSLAFLARTDHGFFLPVTFLLFVWRDARRPMPERIRRAVAFAAPAVVLVGGYLLLNLVTTGHLVPVSGRVKAFWAAQFWTVSRMWADLMTFDLRKIWKIGALGVLWYVAGDVRAKRLSGVGVYAAVSLILVAYYTFNQQPGSLGAFWYFVPSYIVFSLLLADGMQWVAELAGARRRMLQTAFVTGLLLVLAMRVSLLFGYRNRPQGERADMYRIAQVLSERRAQNEGRAAAWDAGIYGFFAGPVTNLDALINSSDYFDRYYSQGRTMDYVREHEFRYIVCYEQYPEPGGLADGILDTHRVVHAEHRWLILERR